MSGTAEVGAFKMMCSRFPGIKFNGHFFFFRDSNVNFMLSELETMRYIKALYFQNNMGTMFDPEFCR